MSDILPFLARGSSRRSGTQPVGFHGAAGYLKRSRLSQPYHDSRVLSLAKGLSQLIAGRSQLHVSTSLQLGERWTIEAEGDSDRFAKPEKFVDEAKIFMRCMKGSKSSWTRSNCAYLVTSQ